MDALLRRIIIGSFHFLLVATPLFFLFSTDELFEFNKMMLVYGVALVVMTAWLIRMILAKRILFKKSPFDLPLLMFFCSQLLATIFSIHPRTSWLGFYSRFHGGLLSTITYLALYWSFVSTVTKKELKTFFLSMIGASFLVSSYAILEHFGHSFSCLLITGGKSFGTDCWIQDVQSRVFATFGQPNWLAAYAITLLPLTLVLTITQKTKTAIAYLIASGALLVTLFYTQSRSGLFGLLAGLAVLLAGSLIALWRGAAAQRRETATTYGPRVVWLIGLTGAITLLWGPPRTLLNHLFNAGNSSNTVAQAEVDAAPVNRLDIGGTDSGEIRKIVWSGALAVGKRYPLFGSGVETFAYSYYLDRPVAHNLVSEWDFLYNKAHNEFLNFLATTGIVGLLSYCTLLIWFGIYGVRALWRVASEHDTLESKLLTAALLAGIVGLSISNFFGFSTVMVSVLMYLWLAILVLTWDWQAPLFTDTAGGAAPLTSTKKNRREYEAQDGTLPAFFSVVVAIIFVVLLGKWYAYWAADINYARGKGLFAVGQYQASLQALSTAISQSPGEALFYDELSMEYAQVATAMAEHDATAAAQLAQAAIDASNTTLKLNNVHLNFYKTRSRMFITLAQLDPAMLQYAREALIAALDRAPTDAKLMYNLGLVEIGMDRTEEGIAMLRKAVAVKANYGAARVQLADALMLKGDAQAALDEYQYIIDHIAPDDARAQAGVASASAALTPSQNN